MKKLLFLILTFFPSLAMAANNFVGDTHVKAQWRFESGALTTDSKSTNTLVVGAGSPTANAINFKEGSYSAQFQSANGDFFKVTNGSLSSGFPGTGSTKSFTITGWYNFTSFPGDGSFMVLASKYDPAANARSYMIDASKNGSNVSAEMKLGFNSGQSFETHTHGSALSAATFYYITESFDSATSAYAVRVKDSSCNAVGTDLTGTATLDGSGLSITTADFGVASFASDNSTSFNGYEDELVVFDRAVTSQESSDLCNQIYPNNGGTTTTTVATTTTTTTGTTIPATHVGFNFRGTSNSGPLGTGEKAVIFTTGYSASQGYGWTTSLDTCGDTSTQGLDNRLLGACGNPNTGSPAEFRYDIGAASNYSICLALGSPSFAHSYQYAQFFDDSNLLISVVNANGTAAVHWLDANNIDRTNTTWPTAVTNGTACQTVYFSSGILRMRLGTPTNVVGDDSTISYFSVDPVGGAPVTTTTTTSTTTTTAATTTTTLPTYDASFKACWGQVTADLNNNALTPDYYNIHWGPYPGFYTQTVNVGVTGTPTAPCVSLGALGMPDGFVSKMSVTAVKTGIGESAISNELQFAYSAFTTTTTVTLPTTTVTTIQGQTTTTTTVGTTTTTLAPSTPAITSFTPSTLTVTVGNTQTFTGVFSNTDGFAAITSVNLSISGGGHPQQIIYNSSPGVNRFVIPGFFPNSCIPGSQVMMVNSFLKFDCSKSTVTGSGNNLTVNFNLTTLPPFASATYAMVLTVAHDVNTKFSANMGTWIVNPATGGRTRSGRNGAIRSQTNRSKVVR